ncbi:histidinol dehydrogenase [Halobacteriales archaeon SW_7_68_16]|nr:MAG: histidinol dehydrogenase [Halobacteriales archaeon SW_7_68_16]
MTEDADADRTDTDDSVAVPVREIAPLNTEERRAIFERDAGVESVRDDAREIVERVRTEGDVALRELAEEIEGVTVGNVEITDEAERAYERLDDDVRAAIETAIGNVRAFHEAQLPTDWRREFEGRELGRRFAPIERVGAYVPGGTAAYPSSAIMTVVPARVAGVETVVAATPPAEDQPDATLAALHAAGADRIVAAGGAQAVAALAYGTESVPRTQLVVGPGNEWVTAAKGIVRGDVEIDFEAGPSEVLVVADDTADPEYVAADVVAQAEHDSAASTACVTHDRETAESVAERIGTLAADSERAETIAAALDGPGSGVFLARSASEATLFAEAYAPEHLAIQTADPEAVLDRVPSAGSAFLGPYSPVAAGDYATGTNHVLPTNGAAAVVSGLSVETFLRSTTVQRLDRAALSDLRGALATLARTEGLPAHAASIDRRFGDDGPRSDGEE